MTFEEFLQSPYLAVIGEKMLEGNKRKCERKYAELNAVAQKGKNVILGDSLVEYFPVWELFDKPLYNRGIGGDSSAETLEKLDATVLPLKAKKAFVWVGTNDIQCGLSVENTVQNVSEICRKIVRNSAASVYVLSVAPVLENSPDEQIRHCVGVRTNEHIKRLNSELKKLCDENGYTFIDVYGDLCSGRTLNKGYTEDGLHLTVEGYKPVVRAMERYL